MTPVRFSSVFLEDQGGLASHPLGTGLSGSFFFELQGLKPEYSTSSPLSPSLLMPGEQGRSLCGQRPQLVLRLSSVHVAPVWRIQEGAPKQSFLVQTPFIKRNQ